MVRQLVRLSRLAIPLALVSLGLSAPVGAQSYPSSMIRIVTGGPVGSPPDIIVRLVANQLSESEGWRIVVENKVGGIASPAAGEVLKQPADGYTVYVVGMTNTVFPALNPNIGYRLDGDFVPVIKLMSAHHVLVVNPTVPARSLPELVAVLKSQPDKLTFSSGGFGTPAHLTGELFKLQTGVRVAHVPYRSAPHMITDLLNGTNHFQFMTPLPVLDRRHRAGLEMPRGRRTATSATWQHARERRARSWRPSGKARASGSRSRCRPAIGRSTATEP